MELRIYEGQTWDLAQEKDITFVHNANFFLFATLEHARMLAHARGTPAPSTNTPPVLTGMPVSGMAYLDRPQEAGYFLFPDLSVRHEGRYKLTFNLYEETKDEKDKDADRESDMQPPIPGMNPATGGSFDFRMEVKSQEFIVYSAKKFPGLAESTQLSRVVAEQGCRVRIRRDVRMRRRDGKGNGDYDHAEDEYTHTHRRSTPAADPRPDYNRARSTSGSLERTPYSADSQRRPSIADYQPQYPPQNPLPGGHLQFLGGNASSQYPAQPQPPQKFAQPPSLPASPVYAQSPAAYPSQSSYHPPPPPPPPAAASYSRGRERTLSQSSYAPITPAPARNSAAPEYRPVTLPPITALAPKPTYNAPPPQHARKQMYPRLSIDASLPHIDTLRIPMPTPTALRLPSMSFGALSMPGPHAGTKRAHDQSFRHESETPRYQDGARDPGLSEDVAQSPEMYYYRANGSVHDAAKLR